MMESEADTNEVDNGKENDQKEVDNGYNSETEKPSKRMCIRSSKPSQIRRSYNVRTEHRARLSCLLGKLTKQHNWKEASGVLSVLLKGTCEESQLMKNRIKYWVAMEILNRMEGDHINPAKIERVYDMWSRKNGMMKNPAKDKYSNQLELVLFRITQGNNKKAHEAIIDLMQAKECGSDGDPILNMMVGLVFYQLWYSTIPEEMRLRNSDISDIPTLSETSEMNSINPFENSDGHNTVDVQDMESPAWCDSDTSVRNDKRSPMDIDGDLQKERINQVSQPLGFNMEESAEMNGHEEASLSNHGDNLTNTSIFYSRGVDTSLLPIRLPRRSTENLEDFIDLHEEMLNGYYTHAVKHLRIALNSTPPLLASLLPLIQLLLLGDQVKEALKELKKFCHNSNTTLPLRLRAILLECFDSKNSSELSTCYEDILTKDPTCSHSLKRLIDMHKNGDYSLEQLLEMIALHLDATYAACSVWGELASCFLNLSQYEEDRVSVCGNANEGGGKQGCFVSFNAIPKAFIQGKSGKSWRLRCRWWSTRHFSEKIHISEMQAGDLQLLTFKAACASHLYGPEFEYVASVYNRLKKEENKDMILFLRMHVKNSVKLFENLNRAN